jgi:hypothetical protein
MKNYFNLLLVSLLFYVGCSSQLIEKERLDSVVIPPSNSLSNFSRYWLANCEDYTDMTEYDNCLLCDLNSDQTVNFKDFAILQHSASITVPSFDSYSLSDSSSDFFSYWLETCEDYWDHPYDLWISPNDPDIIEYPNNYLLWDLNSDQIVNFKDFAMLQKIDKNMILYKWLEKRKEPIYAKTMEQLLVIIEMEIEKYDKIKDLFLLVGEENLSQRAAYHADTMEEWLNEYWLNQE